ncbi:beta-3 adrenergic receptor-like [Patiria miniata]|uniref:G-protein coupled receptors family 1 profile domain-containing protein n=1 Tax=Patiria miniata TaxID=46514 RepID=A0A913ZLZ4_PATMI|nr:beta-3 adrenergic receptor-like [Patiria miniata]
MLEYPKISEFRKSRLFLLFFFGVYAHRLLASNMVDTLQALNTALLVVCSAAVVSNVLAVVIFAATKKLRVKYYAFAFNLVLGDIVAPASILILINANLPKLRPLYSTSLCAVKLSILAIAVNRFLALTITPPARYDAMVTRGRMLAACVLIWIISAAILVPTLLHSKLLARMLQSSTTLGILLITAVFYCAVFRKMSRYTPPLASTEGARADDAVARTRLRQTRHLMITFTIILVTCFACWIPYCIVNFMVYFSGKSMRMSVGPRNLSILSRLVATILMFNSLINPFIYWWRIREFRVSMYRLICRGRGKVDPENDVVTLHTMQEPEN